MNQLRIPDDWLEYSLKDLADPLDKYSFKGGPFGSDLKSAHYTPSGVRVLQLQDIGEGLFLNKSDTYTSDEKADELLASNIYPGDILLAKMAPVARCCIVPDESPRYVMCSDGIRLAVNKEMFDRDYVFHSLNAPRFREKANALSTGTTRARIGLSDLKALTIYCPTLSEQQKIAEILSTVDKKIDLIDQKIAETEKLKTGLMQKLFSEGVGVQDDNGNWNPHTEFKNSNFGSIPSTWEVKNLKQIGECFIGLTYKPEDTTDSSGTLVLRSSNVQNQRLCLSNNVYVKCQIPEKIQVKKGDILICVRNGSRALIGKSALIKKDMDNTTFGAFMSIFRSELSDLIYQLFQTEIYRKQIYKNLGATINQITNKNLYSFEFPIPPKEERQKIVNVLTTIDNNIDLLIKQKAETQQLKKGLMQKLLTGEWRVPVEET